MRQCLRRLLALLALAACALAEVANTELLRTIDTTAAVVRISITARATGVQGSYAFAFPRDIASHIAFIAVKEGDRGERDLPVADVKDRCVGSQRKKINVSRPSSPLTQE
jgi:hypothetical protein